MKTERPLSKVPNFVDDKLGKDSRAMSDAYAEAFQWRAKDDLINKMALSYLDEWDTYLQIKKYLLV